MRIFIFLFTIAVVGCASKIDVLKSGSVEPLISHPTKDVTFSFYNDHNLFQFMSNMTYSMDSEKLKAKHFEIRLPKGISYYEFINGSDFTFYYGRDQVIYLKIDLAEPSTLNSNVALISSTVGIDKLVESAQTNGNKKYKFKYIKPALGRNSLLLEGSGVKIVLHNIKQEQLKDFQSQVESFRFIE